MILKKVQNLKIMIIKIRKMKKKKVQQNFQEEMKMICNNGEEKICQMKLN